MHDSSRFRPRCHPRTGTWNSRQCCPRQKRSLCSENREVEASSSGYRLAGPRVSIKIQPPEGKTR
ncbi:hypothetical protein KW796_01010 [Candidatus Parcubacteria bacterium]|nr:hypothetical protein [Candidatus Parcubacteria bacterium]